jgi:hypothetical protein
MTTIPVSHALAGPGITEAVFELPPQSTQRLTVAMADAKIDTDVDSQGGLESFLELKSVALRSDRPASGPVHPAWP